MPDLLAIARRFLAEHGQGNKGEKGDKSSHLTPFPPLSPFSHSTGDRETAPNGLAGEPWDTHGAVRLLAEGDSLVERLGVDGRHPAIVDAAAMVMSAFEMRDLETVQLACAEFMATVLRAARKDGLTVGHR